MKRSIDATAIHRALPHETQEELRWLVDQWDLEDNELVAEEQQRLE